MSKKAQAPIFSILMTLATTCHIPEVLNALEQLGNYLSESFVEGIRDLARQFRDILERCLMERIATYVNASDNQDWKTLLEDWNHLPGTADLYGDYDKITMELEYYISTLNHIPEYLAQRECYMANMLRLSAAKRTRIGSRMHRKTAELLIYDIVPTLLEENEDPLLRHQFRLWTEVDACIEAGAETYAMFFLCHDGENLRFLAPWNQTIDATVQELYLTADIISAMSRRADCWDHDTLVTCFWHLLDTKVRALIQHDEAMDEDTQALLELYAMVYWTDHQEFRNFWEQPRFQKNLAKYYPKEN